LSGNAHPFVFLSGLFTIYALISGIAFPMDGVTVSVGCFALWLIASLFWTETRQSVFEVFIWLSYLVLFMACRTLDTQTVMLCVFPAGLIAIGVKAKFNVKSLFGNRDHDGFLHVVHMLVALWLSVNVSVWFIPFILAHIAMVIYLKCRAAYVAGACSVIYLFPQSIPIFFLIALIIAVMVWRLKEKAWLLYNPKSIRRRLYMCHVALEMNKKKALFGWGLNMYRLEMPESAYRLMKSEGYNESHSHRVHNDHFELILELGVIGYLIFASIFIQGVYSPIIAAFLIAYAVDMLFFFPLREVHTGAPFWAIAGAAITVPAGFSLAPLKAVVCLIAVYAINIAVRKFLALYYYELAERAETLKEKAKNYGEAAFLDPADGRYTFKAACADENPIEAFKWASISVWNFDGQYLKHVVYDQWARCILSLNHLNAARWALNESLRLDPKQESSRELKGQIEAYMKANKMQAIEPDSRQPKQGDEAGGKAIAGG
jgi:hypothetical protein